MTQTDTQTDIRILEAAFTMYPVKDMKRARAFYEGVLNLKPNNEVATEEWFEYDLNGSTLLLGCYEGVEPAEVGPAIGLEVGDFEATVKALKDNGVKFTMEPMDTPVCHICCILDTEGNSITLHKRKPNHG